MSIIWVWRQEILFSNCTTDSRRARKIPLSELESLVDEADEDLSEYLSQEISDFYNQQEDVKSFAKKFKSCVKKCESLSKNFSVRLSKSGEIHKSNQVQISWTKRSSQISIFKSNLNSMLKELNMDSLSCWEGTSQHSGYSLASQLVEKQHPDEFFSPKSVFEDFPDKISSSNDDLFLETSTNIHLDLMNITVKLRYNCC